jgi:hypothetical protein
VQVSKDGASAEDLGREKDLVTCSNSGKEGFGAFSLIHGIWIDQSVLKQNRKSWVRTQDLDQE